MDCRSHLWSAPPPHSPHGVCRTRKGIRGIGWIGGAGRRRLLRCCCCMAICMQILILGDKREWQESYLGNPPSSQFQFLYCAVYILTKFKLVMWTLVSSCFEFAQECFCPSLKRVLQLQHSFYPQVLTHSEPDLIAYFLPGVYCGVPGREGVV